MMAEEANGFEDGHYLSRSWALLTHDRGWIKPVLVLSLVALVPIIGPIAVLGYALEWARLTAWGVDSSPKQRRVDVGQVLVSGWRGFVVGFVWEFALWVAYALLSWALGHAPGEDMGLFPGGLIDLIYAVASVLLGAIVVVAQVRSAIYQRIGTGLRADRVFQMVGRDFGGLMHMVGMQLLGWLVAALVGLVFGLVAVAVALPYVVGLGYGADSVLTGSHAMGRFIAGILGSLSVPLVLFVFVLSLVTQATTLLVITGVALWMRQFDVPAWGRSGDPLPSRDASGHGEDVPRHPGSAPDKEDGASGAAATRTTSIIVREPGKPPVVGTRTEVLSERGVIIQGPAAEDPAAEESGHTGESDGAPSAR